MAMLAFVMGVLLIEAKAMTSTPSLDRSECPEGLFIEPYIVGLCCSYSAPTLLAGVSGDASAGHGRSAD